MGQFHSVDIDAMADFLVAQARLQHLGLA